jgi:hypothetical protein
MYASNGTSESRLEILPDGQLKQYLPDNRVLDIGAGGIVASSFGTTGYSKRADGLIWQWGESTNVATVQFPITFPHACSQVMVTIDHGSSDYSYANVIAKTTSSFTLYNYSSIITQSYIAVGY